MSDDRSPAEVLAEAIQNGQVHPAVAGFLAHLDDQLGKLVAAQIDDREKVADDQGDDQGADGDQGDDDKAPAAPRKATPSAVAGKQAHR